MKYIVLLIPIVVGCSSVSSPRYTRNDCSNLNLNCYYERGWDNSDAGNTRWIGSQYQCASSISVAEDDCDIGNTYGETTLWCCAPPNLWSGMP